MNRTDFLRRLERALQAMPEEERRRAIEYYENYFDEAGTENEAQVLEELGAPEKVAADILGEFRDTVPTDKKAESKNQKTQQAKDYFQSLDNGQKLLLIGLGIVAAIFILPVAFGVVGGIGGILGGIFAVIVGIFLVVPCLCLGAWAAAISCFVVAGTMVMSDPASCLLCIGIAFIFMAFGLLFGRLTGYLFGTVFPAALNGVVGFIRRLLGGN